MALQGVLSNHSANGAHLAAVTNIGRQVHRYLNAGHGFCSTNSPIQHFGVGADEHINRIDVRWPSGIFQTVCEPEMAALTTRAVTGFPLVPRDEGQAPRLTFAGPAGFDCEVVIGDGSSVTPAGSLRLGADGRGELSLTGRGDSSDLWVQAWIHAPGSGEVGTLTCPVSLAPRSAAR